MFAARVRAVLIALALIIVLGATEIAIAIGAEFSAGPEDYLKILRTLEPGDRLQLKPGIYAEGLPLRGINGSAQAPIVIEGPREGTPALFRARPDLNTVTIADSSHLIVRHLRLDGINLPVDAVVTDRRSRPVHHITLDGLTIVGHGHDQQIVGIGTRCASAFWTIRDNTIIGAGTGMYLGGSDGSAPFVAGVIEGNRVLNTIGYNLQIKHQLTRAGELGKGALSTIIRGNFFGKSSNSSQGAAARPNVLIGHPPITGSGSEDSYRISGNVFYDNPSEVLLQGEGRMLIDNNIFINRRGSAIAIQPHHDQPRDVQVRANFVAAVGFGVKIAGQLTGLIHSVESNVIRASVPVNGGQQKDNVSGPYQGWRVALADWLGGRSNVKTGSATWPERMLDAVCVALTSERRQGATMTPLRDGDCDDLRTLMSSSQQADP